MRLLTPTKCKNRLKMFTFVMLHCPLQVSVNSLSQNSISTLYTSTVPLLACLFLSAVLLQVNKMRNFLLFSVSEHSFSKVPFLHAGLNIHFFRQTCPRLHAEFQLAVWWNVRADGGTLVHFAAGCLLGEKKQLTNRQPTVAFVPPCLRRA